MRKKPQTVLWENVRELMLHHWDDINLYRLGNDSGIGTGGASRIKEQKSATRISTIEKIARVWRDKGVEPWMLLYPDLDPENLPTILSDSEKRLYDRLKQAKAVADGEVQPERAKATAGS